MTAKLNTTVSYTGGWFGHATHSTSTCCRREAAAGSTKASAHASTSFELTTPDEADRQFTEPPGRIQNVVAVMERAVARKKKHARVLLRCQHKSGNVCRLSRARSHYDVMLAVSCESQGKDQGNKALNALNRTYMRSSIV
jgi:hypothetical protein